MRKDDADLRRYYDLHADDYEEIYHRDDPGRREELARMEQRLAEAFRDRRVLEIACGTGWWTQILARCARRVTALDASPRMLELARARDLPPDRVTFVRGDAYDLRGLEGPFDGAVGIFWLSHVPRDWRQGFFMELHGALEPGARVFLADNVFRPGSGGELICRPDERDTYKRRRLADGATMEVLKNYFTAEELRELPGPSAIDLEVHMGQYYWWMEYLLGPA
ncbi:MAG: class I SAM-dependent methyltransferase [Candidatus Zixiibacteriota bacterium]|nr:MAG: class I SAM-dependent methyltransferase [candidate division Zixibacteria bacterium]